MIVLIIFVIVTAVTGQNYTLEDVRSWRIPENILKGFPSYYCGDSYDKSPVWYTQVGKWDIRSIVEQGPEQVEWYKKHVIKLYQNYVDSATNASQGVITIIDMDGFDIRQSTHAGTLLLHIWGMQEWAKYSKYNAIKLAIFLNTNFLYKTLYDATSKYLGGIQNFLELYGTNPNIWKPRLLKMIPPDQLLQYLGGTVKECTPVESFASFMST